VPDAERAPGAFDVLVLASASPRRAGILESLGIPHRVVPSSVDERLAADEPPIAAALRLAEEKAAAVASTCPDATVLGADTLVVLGSRIFGKPSDRGDAGRMLRELSGTTHQVVTGVCLIWPAGKASRAGTSDVTFAPMTDEEIDWYVATGEPADKAGAYAVQGLGARFITGIRGSFSNVVGLPAREVYELLRDAGMRLPGLAQ
jgi:septum formation protein